MLDGRFIKCQIRIEGTGRAFVPNSIPDEEVQKYVDSFGCMWAGNKMISPIIDVWDFEEEIY